MDPKRKGPIARPMPPTENVSELAEAIADGCGMAAGTMASRSLREWKREYWMSLLCTQAPRGPVSHSRLREIGKPLEKDVCGEQEPC